MKKALYCVVVIAAFVFSASCQKETLEVEKTNVVSYTIEIPDAITTKAGETYELIYEVYRTTSDKASDPFSSETYHRMDRCTTSISGNGTVNIDLKLINSQNARVLFWAQRQGNNIYDTRSLADVKLITDNLNSNRNDYVAFAGSDFVKNGEPLAGRTITLRRPVSQLNITTSDESLFLGDTENSTIKKVISVKESSVTVTGLSASFNVADMKAGTDKTEITFKQALCNDGLISSDLTYASKHYKCVAMNYVAFAPADGTIVKVDYTLVTNVGTITNSVNNVSVKPNYRTNIIGNLITSEANYDVTLNNDWAQGSTVESLVSGVAENTDGSYTITSAAGLAYASKVLFANGGTFYVSGNIDMAGMGMTPATVPSGVTLTIIGGPQTRSAATAPVTISNLSINGRYAALLGDVAGTVTINGIKIAGSNFTSDDTDGLAAAFVANATGSVTIEGCSVSGCEIKGKSASGGLIGSSSGSISISGSEVYRCIFDSDRTGSLVGSATGTESYSNDNNAYFNTSTDGEVVSAVGSDPSVEINENPSLDTDDSGVYEVTDSYTLDWVLSKEPVESEDQISVKVNNDITLDSEITIPAGRNIVLDLNGKTVRHEKECTASYEMINNKGSLTITGNGKISFKDTSAGDPLFGWGSYTIRNEGTLVVENGTIEHLGEQNINGVVHMYCAIFQYSGSTTIKDGIISTPTYRSVRLWKGDMTIEGGKFEGQLWVQAVDNSAVLTINGGEFAPRGNDGSSVFVTNADYTVNFSVTDGYFETKIGCSNATKEGVKGAITGGTFTASAKENTNTALLAYGKEFTQGENGNWIVSARQQVAKIGETPYYSLQDAVDAGGEITLLSDITLSNILVVPVNKTVVLDLNGKTVTTALESEGKHYYAFDNKGTLTIKDTAGEGKIVARGNHNYGSLTLKSGTIKACDGNGGYGVRNYSGSSFVMNGGSIATTYEDDNMVDEGGYDATPIRVDEGAQATINDGIVNNVCDFTMAVENYGTTTIKGGTFTSIHTTIANYGTMTIDGGSFKCNGLEGVTAHVLWADSGTATINGGTFDGKDNFNGFNVCASAGATVNIDGGKFLSVHSGSLYGEGTITVTGG